MSASTASEPPGQYWNPPYGEPLGLVGKIHYWIAQTRKPWQLAIDTIVLPVGRQLGGLGHAVRTEFPSAAWNSIPYSSITADRPYQFNVRGNDATSWTLRCAILA